MWKNLFFFAAVPVIIASTVNAFYLADPSEMDPPPFVPYDHLRIRTKVTTGSLIFNYLLIHLCRSFPGEMETIP